MRERTVHRIGDFLALHDCHFRVGEHGGACRGISSNQGDRVMSRVFLRNAFAAALGLSLLSAAAPMAFADSPGYLFQDFESQSSTSVHGDAARTSRTGGNHDKASPSVSPRMTSSSSH
jgi:hypothetical protein